MTLAEFCLRIDFVNMNPQTCVRQCRTTRPLAPLFFWEPLTFRTFGNTRHLADPGTWNVPTFGSCWPC
ncbi:hypothetical protein J6590_038958 [Homalodisca vitripennis]|nr:hypothetical protein J6590_038958 [Homalodisca vitripennis]